MDRLARERNRSNQECPYCAEDMERWSVSFRRTDLAVNGGWPHATASRRAESAEGSWPGRDITGDDVEGTTLLSLCPSDRCGYYALSHGDGLTHWDRDVEAARLLRTLFSGQ